MKQLQGVSDIKSADLEPVNISFSAMKVLRAKWLIDGRLLGEQSTIYSQWLHACWHYKVRTWMAIMSQAQRMKMKVKFHWQRKVQVTFFS